MLFLKEASLAGDLRRGAEQSAVATACGIVSRIVIHFFYQTRCVVGTKKG